ncbi:MAG: hypothetical protein JSU66_10640 [Deltaproteobacteria bacterium]|nr:MAG: hypothetical protein JSU66_10640 [Deltaproteobacteria bacterium]
MGRPSSVAAFLLAGPLLLAGCGFHMAQVEVRRPFPVADFDAIEVGANGRADVLARLGPPDRLSYTLADEVLEYDTGRHRATDLRFFVPSDALRLPGLGTAMGILGFFFEPFEESEAFRQPRELRASTAVLGAVGGLVPFTGGSDVLTLRGRQLRTDRIRVIVDRETLRVKQKALLLATDDLERQSIVDRATLRTD